MGYGASPERGRAVLRDIGATCVLGNHDRAALDGDVGDFNPRAAMAAIWTSQHLTDESREFLGSLPREVSTEMGGRGVYMAHGSPDDTMWEYVLPSTHSDLFDYYLQKVHADVIALGHTHLAFQWRSDTRRPGLQPRLRRAAPQRGHEGLVRDPQRRGRGEVRVEARQVEYDVERAAKKILESGLPPSLASQLFSGE